MEEDACDSFMCPIPASVSLVPTNFSKEGQVEQLC